MIKHKSLTRHSPSISWKKIYIFLKPARPASETVCVSHGNAFSHTVDKTNQFLKKVQSVYLETLFPKMSVKLTEILFTNKIILSSEIYLLLCSNTRENLKHKRERWKHMVAGKYPSIYYPDVILNASRFSARSCVSIYLLDSSQILPYKVFHRHRSENEENIYSL